MHINDESNITIQEVFLFEIDKSIESGDVKFIENALVYYKNQISKDLVDMANRIILELITEKVEDFQIK